MPGAHRNNDLRGCGAHTIVSHQNTVYVNNKLWSLDGDVDDHCNAGPLKPIYGTLNVFINNILVICAVGDTAYSPDFEGCVIPHLPGGGSGTGDDPNQSSENVFVYG